MTLDLFPRLSFEQLRLPNADVSLLSRLSLPIEDDVLLDRFVADVPWRQEQVVVWGKTHRQPRLVAWFGDPGAGYSYSGIRLEPLPWTPDILALKRAVEGAVDASFNSVLLNFYRDHRDSMGFHSDDEPELGIQPTIASLSFGAKRTFLFKSKLDRSLPAVRLPLTSGSLLLMKGDTQANWKHGIPKERRPCGPRINLTFRRIFPRN
jgi:alkylated DNA repair dioxygenase AlkB